MAEAAPTPDLPQPTAVANPPQNPAQSAAAPSQADPQNAPPTPATPPTRNAANDPQKAPVSPAPAPLSNSQNPPGNLAAPPPSDPQKTPANSVAVPPTNPQEAPTDQSAAPPVDPGQIASDNPTSNPSNPNNPPKGGDDPVPVDPSNSPSNSPQGGNGDSPAATPNNETQPQSNPNPVDNNNQAPASAAPNEQPGPQANPNAANSNNRGPTPADNAQPQGMPYNPQEGGFDPAPVKPGQSAAAAAVAAPATPGTLQGTPSILNHPDDKTLPNNDQNAANQPVRNTPTGANHIVPNQPNGNSQAGTNQQPSQNEPAPLVVGSDGGILVDSGSHNSPAIPGAVPNNVPAATGAAAPQPANAAAPPTISVDNNGNIYAAAVQPANINAPPRVSVANDGKIYAAPVMEIAQPVATPAPSLSVGGKAAQVGPDGAFHVAGQTIARGAQVTVNGAVVSVGANNVVVDGKTQALPVAPNASPLQNALPPSIGGQSIRIAQAGALVIGSQTITQGNKVTIAGSVVSVGSNNVAVDGSIFALSGVVVPTAFAAPAPLAVAGQAIQTAPNGGIIAAGQTIAQGSQATVSGTVLSVGSSNIVLGSSTYALPANTPPAVVGQAIQPAPSGGLVVVGQTVAQGQKATISGTVVSVGSSNFVLGSSTYALPANTPPPVGGQAVQAAPNGGLVVAGQTIAQGQQATIAGTLVSIGSSNIIVGGSTYPPPGILAAKPTPAGLSIGGQAIQTAPNGGLVIAGQTISQGSPATTISGTILSVGSSNIVLGSSTYALPSHSETTPTQAPLLIAGNPVQIASNGALIIASQTISQGSQTTISGVTISIGSSALVIDGTTHAFNPTGAAIPTEKSNDQLILTQGEVVTEGNSIITYSGPAVSAFVKDGDIVVGTATLPLGASMTGAAASQGALGGMILSALGNNGPSGSATNSTSGSGSSSQPTVNVVKPSAAVGSVSRGVTVDWALLRLMGLAYIEAMGLMGLVIIY